MLNDYVVRVDSSRGEDSNTTFIKVRQVNPYMAMLNALASPALDDFDKSNLDQVEVYQSEDIGEFVEHAFFA